MKRIAVEARVYRRDVEMNAGLTNTSCTAPQKHVAVASSSFVQPSLAQPERGIYGLERSAEEEAMFLQFKVSSANERLKRQLELKQRTVFRKGREKVEVGLFHHSAKTWGRSSACPICNGVKLGDTPSTSICLLAITRYFAGKHHVNELSSSLCLALRDRKQYSAVHAVASAQ